MLSLALSLACFHMRKSILTQHVPAKTNCNYDRAIVCMYICTYVLLGLKSLCNCSCSSVLIYESHPSMCLRSLRMERFGL